MTEQNTQAAPDTGGGNKIKRAHKRELTALVIAVGNFIADERTERTALARGLARLAASLESSINSPDRSPNVVENDALSLALNFRKEVNIQKHGKQYLERTADRYQNVQNTVHPMHDRAPGIPAPRPLRLTFKKKCQRRLDAQTKSRPRFQRMTSRAGLAKR
jgi:hypothetical protein